MYRMVASDMDETFLDMSHRIPQANIDAVARMRERGILFVPASGRPYSSIRSSLSDMPLELLEGSYVISFNGGCITRVGDDGPIVSTSLPFPKLKALFDYGTTLDVGIHVYELSGTVQTWNIDGEETAYLRGHMATKPLAGPSVDPLAAIPCAKILYCLPGGIDRLHDILDAMPAELLEGIAPTFSSQRYLEFNPAGVDKGKGLARLADLVGIPLSTTIACGDADNDIAMLEMAGVGVAVANANDATKAQADYRAASTCDDGVIAEVWERFCSDA